jgi:hypothetical protein
MQAVPARRKGFVAEWLLGTPLKPQLPMYQEQGCSALLAHPCLPQRHDGPHFFACGSSVCTHLLCLTVWLVPTLLCFAPLLPCAGRWGRGTASRCRSFVCATTCPAAPPLGPSWPPTWAAGVVCFWGPGRWGGGGWKGGWGVPLGGAGGGAGPHGRVGVAVAAGDEFGGMM